MDTVLTVVLAILAVIGGLVFSVIVIYGGDLVMDADRNRRAQKQEREYLEAGYVRTPRGWEWRNPDYYPDWHAPITVSD